MVNNSQCTTILTKNKYGAQPIHIFQYLEFMRAENRHSPPLWLNINGVYSQFVWISIFLMLFPLTVGSLRHAWNHFPFGLFRPSMTGILSKKQGQMCLSAMYNGKFRKFKLDYDSIGSNPFYVNFWRNRISHVLR